MKIILDTPIYLWALGAPNRLSVSKRNALKLPGNSVYLISVSIAELMIKCSIGKLKIDFDPVELAEKSGFELLDFSARDAIPLKTLPFHHRDPFDRMLIAQSLSRGYSLMTDDEKI